MSIGNPISLTSQVASKTISIIATASQTAFTVTGGYRINQLAVFRNGIRLVDSRDYEARDGATVTLLSAASDGDAMEFQVFDAFQVADTINPYSTYQTIDGNLNITGIITAATFSVTDLDVRNITGVAATFTGQVTYEDVTNVDSIGLSTFRAGVHVTGGSVGIGTDTIAGKVQIDTTSGSRALTVNAPTNGTYITFETNDTPYADIGSEAGAVGSGTNDLLVLNARSTRDLAFRTNSAERLRITSTGRVRLPDNGNLAFGTDEDMLIRHSGSDAVIENTVGHIYFSNYSDNSDINLRSDDGAGGIANYIQCDGSSGAVILNHYGSEKFTTTSSGVEITGTINATSNITQNGTALATNGKAIAMALIFG
jgi:hypothetical protein